MFQIKKYKDHFGREYDLVGTDENDWGAYYKSKTPPKKKVYALILTYNSDDYLDYCLKAVKNQVDGIFGIDNNSTNPNVFCILMNHKVKYKRVPKQKELDLSELANKCLDQIPKNSWVFYVNPDEILYDLPDNYLGALAHFLESKKIYCADIRFPDFIYNYGTLFAGFDWGDGPGNYWTARRLFKWTGKEKFIHKTHFNISNVTPDLKEYAEYTPNNEHTGEWAGTVAKLKDVKLFHYGKLRGVERQRGKGERLLNGELMAKGIVPTVPYHGRHPSVLGLD